MRSYQSVEHVRMCHAKYCAPGETPSPHPHPHPRPHPRPNPTPMLTMATGSLGSVRMSQPYPHP